MGGRRGSGETGGRGNPTYYHGDLRADLVAAAAELISEKGVHGVSLRQVARVVGVSHAAPAHHFGDRTGLLTSVATAGFNELADRLEEATAASGRSPLDRLADAGVAYVGFGSTRRAIFEMMFRPDELDTANGVYLVAALRARSVLVDAVKAARAAGWAPGRTDDDMALVCWALVHGLASLMAGGAIGSPGDPAALERCRLVIGQTLDDLT